MIVVVSGQAAKDETGKVASGRAITYLLLVVLVVVAVLL